MEKPNTAACNCPRCGSENTQPATLVVANGTTETQGNAIGYDSNLDVGMGAYQSVTQTALARMLDPGPRPSSGLVGLIVGIPVTLLMALVFATGGANIITVPIAAFFLFCVVDYFVRRKRVREWPIRMKHFARQWFCHRCGTVWEPS